MNRLFRILICSTLAVMAVAEAQRPLPQRKDELLPMDQVIAHDPVIAEQDGVYYLFTTGNGIPIWQSTDLSHWTRAGRVFDDVPRWTRDAVPGFEGHIWAPDIYYFRGQYYLFYAVSTFGHNLSAIGLATNRTLNPESYRYKWVDEGLVIESLPGRDDWNSIDPQLVLDEVGDPYLAFGSFWSGLKLVRLSHDAKKLEEGGEGVIAIASRRFVPADRPEEGQSLERGGSDIEGPFIFRRGGEYFLFASTGYCCRGRDSTYRMIVGRAKDIEGPYLDRKGHRLLDGGGTLLLESYDRWQGVGHNAVYQFDGKDYLVFHGYDGDTERGVSKLRILPLSWDGEGWPVVAVGEQ